ncbi:chromosome segregation protein SMC [Malaciobacter molluscorum LMG 25693]|uniref:Chromosome segregation protein SMC n=1 Tax=Malaciobacter molluscorum LMG 25693 TaxID=870501 RepID=A0A2G1DKE5_9BACT|nr:SMC family ATPase [Malaciobacter molluscorum]AXX92957.1 SbcCD-like exonuclease, ATPase subunit [Malaciobacter molluscorum LMG 25693]PHO18786.1 chromosome segregation protein SMC [Malaciobacter molluscorum LMG 25693]
MILSKLYLKNFKKYKEFTFEFFDGLTGIIGKNGSGKSTIFDAILFALYGELKNKGSKELIKNVSAELKDELKVKLYFEFDNCEYIVSREFRGKNLIANAKLFKNAELITNGAKEVTKEIIKLTKMNKEAFLSTLFASQKELTKLSGLDKEERKKMIRKLLGLEKIDFVENFLTLSLRDLNRDIKNFSSYLLSIEDVDELNKKLKYNNDNLKILNSQIFAEEKKKEELIKNENKKRDELEIFNKIKEQKKSLEYSIKLEETNLLSFKKNLQKYKEELELLNKQKIEFEKVKNVKILYEELLSKVKEQDILKEKFLKKEALIKERDELRLSYKKQKDDISYLEEQLKQLANIEKEHNSIKENIIIYQKQLQDKKITERELRDKIAGEENLINDTKNKIETIQKLGKNSKCPTCTRDLLDDYDMVLDNLYNLIESNYKKNIEEYNIKLNTLLEEINQKQLILDESNKKEKQLHSKIYLLHEKKKDLSNNLNYLEDIKLRGKNNNDQIDKLSSYIYDEKQHKLLKEKLEVIRKDYEYFLTLQTQLEREKTIINNLQEQEKNIDNSKSNIKNRNIEFESIKYDEIAHKNLQLQIEKMRKQKDDLSDLIHDKKLEDSRIKNEIKNITKQLDENNHKNNILQKKIDDLNDYTKIKITLQDFKTTINSKIAPRISQIASNMYAKITKGKYQLIEVSNDFDFFIYDENRKYPIERFSGGEIDLANLVLRIAISKTLQELSGSSQISFLAFDEVFGSQDENRRLEILEAFNTIKEQYRQIFLISHELEIKEMFERVIEL